MGTKAGTGMSHNRNPIVAGEEAVRAALRQGHIDRPDFIFMFASVGFDQAALLSAVQKTAGHVPLVGCSGEGVIVGDEPDETNFSVGIMAIQSDEIFFNQGMITDLRRDNALAGRAIGDSVRGWKKGSEIGLIVLPDALSLNFDQFLAGIEDGLPGASLPIWGGAAGENYKWVATYQYCDEMVASDAVSFVLLSGKLRAVCGMSHGCVPIGAERFITKCEGRTIQEIDGKPALDVLVEYVGAEQVDRWHDVPTVLGLGLQAPGSMQGAETAERLLIRTMVGGKDDVARTFNIVTEPRPGDKIWFLRRDFDKIYAAVDDAVMNLRQSLRSQQPKLVLQFECCGRGQTLLTQQERQEVLSKLRSGVGPDAAWLGFFTYAEIGPVNGYNCLHNLTAVVLAFYDAPDGAQGEEEARERFEPHRPGTLATSGAAASNQLDEIAALKEQNRLLSEQAKRLIIAEHDLSHAREKLEGHCNIYRRLYEKGKQLNDTLDMHQIVSVATNYVVYSLNFQRCVVLLRAVGSSDLAVVGFEGYYEQEEWKPLLALRLDAGVEFVQPESLQKDHVLWAAGEVLPGLRDFTETLGMDGGGVAVPLQIDTRTVSGWILAGNAEARREYYTAVQAGDGAIVSLANLATQVSIAVKNAQLYREQMEMNAALCSSRLALEARIKQLETVAYIAAHDLRGGADQAQYDAEELTSIMDDLPAELVEKHDLREIVDNLAAAARQQVTLLDGIDAMVALWKNDVLEVEAFDARAFIEENLGDVHAFTGEDIRVEDLGVITANKGMLWTILFNLVKNALKFSDKSHKTVRIYRTTNSLHVEDNGNGIPEDKLGLVTQIFQRLDKTKPGKGLGLAICEAMIQKHGWSLSIRSRLGEGSTFSITF